MAGHAGAKRDSGGLNVRTGETSTALYDVLDVEFIDQVLRRVSY